MRSPQLPAGTGLALAVLAVLVVVAVVGELGGNGGAGGAPVPPSAAALSVYDGRSPSEPGGREQRVLVELARPALADRDDLESLSADDQRAYVRSLEREGTALRSALDARGVELRDPVPFGRTWDGFAATVDSSDLAALSSLGVRALPVRRFYPATSEPVPVPSGAVSASGGPSSGASSGGASSGGASSGGASSGGASSGGASSGGASSGGASSGGASSGGASSGGASSGGASSGGASSGGASSGGASSGGASSGATPPADQTPVAVLDTGADTQAAALRGRVAPGFDVLERDADPAPGADVRTPSRRETTGTALAGLVAAAGERVLTIRIAGYASARPEIHGTTDTLLSGLERAVDPDGDGAVDDAVRVALVGVNAPYAAFADSAEAQAVRGAGKLGTLVVAPAGNEGPARPPNGVVGSPGAARTALAAGATEAGAGVPRVAVTVGERVLRGAVVLGGAPPSGSERLAGPVTGTDTAALLRGRVKLAGRIALVRAGANPVAQASAAAAAGAPAVLLADPRDRPLPMMPAGRVAAPVVGLTGAAAKAALAAAKDARVRFGKVTLGRPKAAAGGTPSGGTPSGGTPSGGDMPAPFSSRGPAFDGSPKPDVVAEGAAVTGVGLVTGTAVAAARVAVRASRLARERPAETPAALRSALVPQEAAEAGGAPPAPAVPLGPLELTRSGDAVVGVRFALGAFERGDPLAGGTRIEPAARLDLELLDARGAVQQRLTPPDGARDLLPAEYAYRLPRKALNDLDPGAYRFRATARAPRRDRPRTRRSPAFRTR